MGQKGTSNVNTMWECESNSYIDAESKRRRKEGTITKCLAKLLKLQ
jgi:hypothetical protein